MKYFIKMLSILIFPAPCLIGAMFGVTVSRVVAQLHQPAVSLFVAFQSQGRVQTAGAQGRTQVCLEDRREKIGMVMAARGNIGSQNMIILAF